MEDLPEILNAIRKPLLFILRTQFRRITSVKGLEGTISQLVERAIVSGGVKESQQERLLAIREEFLGFSGRDEQGKRHVVEKALDNVEAIQGEISGKGPAESSRQPAGELEAVDGPSEAEPKGGDEIFFSIAERCKALSAPIQYVKGVGPRLAALLKRKGIETVEDALYFIPRQYEDRRSIKPIAKAEVGCRETLRGEIVAMNLVPYKWRKVFEMVIRDSSGSIVAKWFNVSGPLLAYLKKQFKKGQEVIVTGRIDVFGFQKELSHPDITALDEEDSADPLQLMKIIPTYSETEGLHQKTLRRIMRRVVESSAAWIPDALPRELCRRKNLVDMSLAIRRVHLPENDDDFHLLVSERSPYHRRIVFDEFFFLELRLALRRQGVKLEKGKAFRASDNFLSSFESMLPFGLTSAQKRVIQEIQSDMMKAHPMNRLLQGDVGSGKTVVSLAAALIAVENGCQVAIMAPTELLAEQHYLNIHPLADRIGLKTALLSGSTKRSTRSTLYQEIRNGMVHLVIGTHAVIEEMVEFSNLGLGIIDEQHRFGVIQRAALKKKGDNPHILVMTATPIPRTLAMTVYGDLDISVIDEMPPGRIPVNTSVFHEKDRAKVYEIIAREVEKGYQVYIVYPLIEESEKMDLMNASRMYEHLQQEVFPSFRLALLHGRMKSEEKERVMGEFKNGSIQVLVATTVIEVGIDIPHATLMVVEHAERFGLSQLHQLRGRVGRGKQQSTCILLAQYRKSDEARRRLQIMEATNDGFRIAEEDLDIRGPGEFIGVRQSGIPDFRVANIIRDARVLNEAREEAFALVKKDPLLEHPDHSFLKEMLQERWKGRFELAEVG